MMIFCLWMNNDGINEQWSHEYSNFIVPNIDLTMGDSSSTAWLGLITYFAYSSYK